MNNSPEALIAARKRLRLTQVELAVAVLHHVSEQQPRTGAIRSKRDLDHSPKYLQKKISYWESGHAKPNPQELAALAEILRIDREQVQSWFSKSPSSAEELFMSIAESKDPAVVAVCYSGRPRAAINEKVFSALVAGLNRKMFLAMYFPYPLFSGEGRGDNGSLFELYRDVWNGTKNHYEKLRCLIPGNKRDRQLALFVPRTSASEVLVPPYAHRYTLIIESSKTREYNESLYTWVESEKIDGLYRVGTFSTLSIRPHIDAWRTYFGRPLREWLEARRLGKGAGFWRRYMS